MSNHKLANIRLFYNPTLEFSLEWFPKRRTWSWYPIVVVLNNLLNRPNLKSNWPETPKSLCPCPQHSNNWGKLLGCTCREFNQNLNLWETKQIEKIHAKENNHTHKTIFTWFGNLPMSMGCRDFTTLSRNPIPNTP